MGGVEREGREEGVEADLGEGEVDFGKDEVDVGEGEVNVGVGRARRVARHSDTKVLKADNSLAARGRSGFSCGPYERRVVGL